LNALDPPARAFKRNFTPKAIQRFLKLGIKY
jgi:hypothetical protein